MQTKFMSFVEANVNSIIGLLISYTFTLYGLPFFGLQPSMQEAGLITLCYFVLSLGRGYIIRRFFNKAITVNHEATPRFEVGKVYKDGRGCYHYVTNVTECFVTVIYIQSKIDALYIGAIEFNHHLDGSKFQNDPSFDLDITSGITLLQFKQGAQYVQKG